MSDLPSATILVDPLLLLRRARVERSNVEADWDAKSLAFIDYNIQIPSTATCRWRNRYQSLYAAGDLWFFLSHGGSYTPKETQQRDLGYVSILEKKSLHDFLEGKKDTAEQIDEDVPLVEASILNSDIPVDPEIIAAQKRTIKRKRDLPTDAAEDDASQRPAADQIIDTLTVESLPKAPEPSSTQPWSLSSRMGTGSINDLLASRDHQSSRRGGDESDTNEDIMAHITRNEVAAGSCNTILSLEIKHLDFTRVINVVERCLSDPGSSMRRGNQRTNKNGATVSPEQREQRNQIQIGRQTSAPRPRGPGSLLEYLQNQAFKPIIIVPSSSRAPMNLTCAREFFVEKRYRPPKDSDPAPAEQNFDWRLRFPWKSQNGASTESEHEITIRVYDASRVPKFTKKEWYSTIAVFLQGPEWQLAKWPFRNKQDLFSCIKGYYVAFDDEELPQTIRSWPVEVLRVKRESRHSDASAWMWFVQGLNKFISQPRDFKKFDKDIIMHEYGKLR